MPEKFSIRYLPVAENDLAEILLYAKERNKSAAQDLLTEIRKGIENLEDSPLLGAIPKDEMIRKTGHRFLVVNKYLVFYIVRDRIIEIRRILHGARDILALLY